eukprot:7281498-Prymnesium_polylepis.1
MRASLNARSSVTLVKMRAKIETPNMQSAPPMTESSNAYHRPRLAAGSTLSSHSLLPLQASSSSCGWPIGISTSRRSNLRPALFARTPFRGFEFPSPPPMLNAENSVVRRLGGRRVLVDAPTVGGARISRISTYGTHRECGRWPMLSPKA